MPDCTGDACGVAGKVWMPDMGALKREAEALSQRRATEDV